jgi:hypothetical protein
VHIRRQEFCFTGIVQEAFPTNRFIKEHIKQASKPEQTFLIGLTCRYPFPSLEMLIADFSPCFSLTYTNCKLECHSNAKAIRKIEGMGQFLVA